MATTSKWAKGAPTTDIGVPDFAWGQWGQGLLSRLVGDKPRS